MSKEAKLLIIFFIIYFSFSWILTWTYFITHLKQIPEYWETKHRSFLEGGVRSSAQFRVLSFWIPELVSKAFAQPIFASYLIVRFVFTFLIFCVFHLFLLKWFNQEKAFLSVTFLAAITPLTYLPFFQEADVILQFFFLICLWLTRERKFYLLLSIIAIATFAKETIVFIIPFYFLLYWRKDKKWKIILESLILVVAWFLAFYVTHHAIYEGQNSRLWQLPYNLYFIKEYFEYNPLLNVHLLYIPLFGLFWFLPFFRLKDKPPFFQVAAPFIIIFTILNFLFGWPEETRIMLPLAFLVIPSGIMVLFPSTNIRHA